MTITDERLAELAADAVEEAIQDLAGDRMGHNEILGDEDGFDDLAHTAKAELCDRFEAAIRRHL